MTMEPLWRAGVRDHARYRSQGDLHRPELADPKPSAGNTSSPCSSFLVRLRYARPCRRYSRPSSLLGPHEANLENAAKIRTEWTIGRDDPAATQALLHTCQATPEGSFPPRPLSCSIRDALGSLWDAAILAACELLMHSPGIVAIHATTATNALHYIYTASGDDTTRRLARCSRPWAGSPMYRGRVKLTDSAGIDSLKVTPDVQVSSGDEAVGEIFASISQDRKKAGTMALAYLACGGSPWDLDLRRGPAWRSSTKAATATTAAAAALWEETLWSTEPRWAAIR